MSAQQDVDRICNWYDVNKPEVKEIKVRITKDTAKKFGRVLPDGSIEYRGRIIVCLNKSAREIRAAASLSANQEAKHE